MLAHGQTTTWDVKVGMRARPGRIDWLRRLRSWLRHPTRRPRDPAPPVAYAYWDGQREQLRQPIREAALDHATAQLGQAWTIMLYSSLR
jgi:hypothetical protein